MEDKSFSRIFLLIQLATVAVFLGRAWQHLYWDAPYRVLLWDENWMRPIVQGIFGIEWETYVTDIQIDKNIQFFIRLNGVFYILCALAATFIQSFKKISVVILWLGAASLAFLAFLYAKDKFFQIAQFLEYALQWGSPVFLIILYQKQELDSRTILWMKIAIALTFVCHGLYAVGLGNTQRSVEFVQMTMNILHLNESNAIRFLQMAGLFDFIASGLLFLPKKWSVMGLIYCVMWGFFTTTARVWANFYPNNVETVLLQWLHESVYRFPHFLIPLAVLTVIRYRLSGTHYLDRLAQLTDNR